MPTKHTTHKEIKRPSRRVYPGRRRAHKEHVVALRNTAQRAPRRVPAASPGAAPARLRPCPCGREGGCSRGPRSRARATHGEKGHARAHPRSAAASARSRAARGRCAREAPGPGGARGPSRAGVPQLGGQPAAGRALGLLHQGGLLAGRRGGRPGLRGLQEVRPVFRPLAQLPPPVQELLQGGAFVLREPQLMDYLREGRGRLAAAGAVSQRGERESPTARDGGRWLPSLQALLPRETAL